MTIRTRKLKVGDVVFDVPRCVYRRRDGWRVQVERVGQKTIRKNFIDGACALSALQRAAAWLQKLEVRSAFREIPLHRQAHRRITLARRTDRDGKAYNRWPAYSLEFEPSKSEWMRGWMKIFAGSAVTLTQKRLDEALASMAGRIRAYRENAARSGAEKALDA